MKMPGKEKLERKLRTLDDISYVSRYGMDRNPNNILTEEMGLKPSAYEYLKKAGADDLKQAVLFTETPEFAPEKQVRDEILNTLAKLLSKCPANAYTIRAVFVSGWDGLIEVVMPCKVNLKTRRITNVRAVNVEGLEVLDHEYVEFGGNRYEAVSYDDYDEEAANDETVFYYK